jgi:2-polyprenyl-3-methyl-5-hydroxy-6-metoxy-1,4-benzoquinol methylase
MFLSDRLRKVWSEVSTGHRSQESALAEQERLLEGYRHEWRDALLGTGEIDLRTSLLREIGAYYDIADLTEVERSCTRAVATLRDEWRRTVDVRQRGSIEKFYESPTTVYELMDWHALGEDAGPLAYVLGLKIAQAHNVQTCLDFGSGVGSGALLFLQAGVQMALADISTTLLAFARWRFEQRGLAADYLDLNRQALPVASFDMVLAMDVFEHLTDPVETAERLHRALKPGGLLFARIHAEEDANRPQHIARDFAPTFARMQELGFVEIWRDTWLWGHQLFEKRPA